MPVSSSTSPATLNRTRPSLPALSDSHFRIYRTKWEIRNPHFWMRMEKETKTEREKTKRAGKTVEETLGCRPCGPNVCSKRRKTSNQLVFCCESEIEHWSIMISEQSRLLSIYNLTYNLIWQICDFTVDVSWLGCNWTIDWVSCFKNQPPNPFEENSNARLAIICVIVVNPLALHFLNRMLLLSCWKNDFGKSDFLKAWVN